jgi:hypothetical protein
MERVPKKEIYLQRAERAIFADSCLRSLSPARSRKTRYMLFAVAFGQIIFERPVVKLLAASPLEPSHILSVFRALQ